MGTFPNQVGDLINNTVVEGSGSVIAATITIAAPGAGFAIFLVNAQFTLQPLAALAVNVFNIIKIKDGTNDIWEGRLTAVVADIPSEAHYNGIAPFNCGENNAVTLDFQGKNGDTAETISCSHYVGRI